MKRIAIIAVAAALVLAACQSASDKLAEELTEKIVEESAGVDDLEIDADSGEISFETDEGSFSMGGGDLPDDFPVPLPDGYSVQAVFTSPGGSSVSVAYARDRFDDLVSYFGDWTDGQPGDWTSNTSTLDMGDGQTMRSVGWFGDGLSVQLSDCSSADHGGVSGDFNAVCASIITGLAG